ncbi:conserved hypothetical protein [Ricinus communis]|uniref:DUF3444 domain-containing protein n=1 Tax=Ricinus communis TaxID=3988 RepID=B9RGY3_RICCO|nr:conserved hypothetical protein [Ricinus communis]
MMLKSQCKEWPRIANSRNSNWIFQSRQYAGGRIPAYTCADEEMDKLSNRMFKLNPSATPAQSIESLPLSDTELLNQQRTAKDFASNQVWAVYHGTDSMPRRVLSGIWVNSSQFRKGGWLRYFS